MLCQRRHTWDRKFMHECLKQHLWRASCSFYGEKEKCTHGIWCTTCHHRRVISLKENCLRPFHIFHTSHAVNTLCPPLSNFTPSAQEIASREIQYAACFTCLLHVLFIFKLLRRAVLHISPTGLSALILSATLFFWLRKDETKRFWITTM